MMGDNIVIATQLAMSIHLINWLFDCFSWFFNFFRFFFSLFRWLVGSFSKGHTVSYDRRSSHRISELANWMHSAQCTTCWAINENIYSLMQKSDLLPIIAHHIFFLIVCLFLSLCHVMDIWYINEICTYWMRANGIRLCDKEPSVCGEHCWRSTSPLFVIVVGRSFSPLPTCPSHTAHSTHTTHHVIFVKNQNKFKNIQFSREIQICVTFNGEIVSQRTERWGERKNDLCPIGLFRLKFTYVRKSRSINCSILVDDD